MMGKTDRRENVNGSVGRGMPCRTVGEPAWSAVIETSGSVREMAQAEGCAHAALEGTGVYPKPMINILEDDPAWKTMRRIR